MDLAELFSRFAVALGVGMLIGIERGWKTRAQAPGGRTAGIRTFALSGLLGGVFGALAQAGGGAASAAGAVLLGLTFAVFAAVFALFCRDENRAENTFSATTAVAGMVTFALGAYALIGDLRMVAAIAVAATILLAVREGLHRWVENLTWRELRAGIVLLAMTFIALPLLPADAIGPFGGVNLREIWLIAIVLASVSFLGYAAVKYLGPARGILIAAAAGGLVSSTAVMTMNARRAAAGEGSPRLLAAGATVATAVSLLRTVAIVGAFNAGLLAIVAAPLVVGAAASVGVALWLARRGPGSGEEAGQLEFGNPFELGSVFGFALFLGAVLIAARVMTDLFGTGGAVGAALVAGLADTDAVSVSMAKLAPESLGMTEAGLAVLAAVATNSLSKLAIGAAIGRGRFAVLVTATTAVAFAAAVVALALAWRLN